jgi:hypothetical protein
MSGKQTRGGHSSRDSVKLALNGAISTAMEIGEDDGIDHILQQYNHIYKAKHKGTSQGNIVEKLLNSTSPILTSYSYIFKESMNKPWGKHFHAVFIVGVKSDDEGGGIDYYEFSHAVQFILISRHNLPTNSYTGKVTCFVNKQSSKTLGDITRMSIYHWYAVNGIKNKHQWPTSCTGFTDFLMYYTYSQDFDILSKCPLTIQRKVTGLGDVHHIYTDPIQPISADVTMIVDKNENNFLLDDSKYETSNKWGFGSKSVRKSVRKSRRRKSVRKSRRRKSVRKSRRRKSVRKSRRRKSVRKSRRRKSVRKSRRRKSVRKSRRRKSTRRK